MYKSLDEAMSAKLDLAERIQSIDVQLSERAAQIVGRVPDQVYKDYLEWKTRACRAKMTLTVKLQRTKRWIADKKAEERTARRSDNQLLNELYNLTKTLVANGADITADEQHLLDDVGQFLDAN